MHNDGNVVPLRRVGTDQTTHPPLARLPVIVLQVRDKATQQLRQGLQALFDNADDSLFEMADRALDDVEQNLLFEAMRDLRLKRKSIERLFFEQFFEAFISLGHCDLAYRALPRSLSADTRGALPDDGLERNQALDAMVNQVLYRDGFALDQLTARLSTLLGRTLIEQNNPLGPTMLCQCFLGAGRHLGVDIKVKLIILKLFDRYVLSNAGQLYAQANQLLVATGVLPGLTPAPTISTTDNASAGTVATPADPQADEIVPAVLAALQDLLLQVRASIANSPGAEAGDHERDSLYRRIEQVAQRFLDEFVDDPAIFSELLNEFLAFARDERRRRELLEQRIRDAEESRGRTALARQRVEQALNQALLGEKLPQSVLGFVQDAWSNVLLMTCLKHGHLSLPWQADVQTMVQLIWSVQRHDLPDAREHLLTLVPGLLKSLREGLSSSAFDPFATSKFFSELERLHVQLFEHPGHSPGATAMVEVLEPFTLPTAGESPADTARVLEDSALFERALASVIAKLQRLNRV